MSPVFIIVLVVVLVCVLGYFGYLAEKKRREEMAALAASLGLRFDPGPDHGHDEEYGHFEIFRRGHSRVALNTMSGDLPVAGRSCRVVAGDFRYKVTSGSGKNRRTHTHNFSYAIVELPFQAPALLIRPEGMFDKLAGVFGFDDIDFESEEFSRKFYVKSPDKKFAYDVLHPRMMEFLLANRAAALDLEYGRVCLADGSRRWDAPAFRRQLSFLERFLELWPEHVLAALEGGAGHGS